MLLKVNKTYKKKKLWHGKVGLVKSEVQSYKKCDSSCQYWKVASEQFEKHIQSIESGHEGLSLWTGERRLFFFFLNQGILIDFSSLLNIDLPTSKLWRCHFMRK